MSQGEMWVGRVMWPLREAHQGVPSHIYNRIYEAVGRGSEAQGKALVRAVLEFIELRIDAEPMTPEQHETAVRRAMNSAWSQMVDDRSPSAGDWEFADRLITEYRKVVAQPSEERSGEVSELLGLLDMVLRTFTVKGHPGKPCLRSDWISEETVTNWRAEAQGHRAALAAQREEGT